MPMIDLRKIKQAYEQIAKEYDLDPFEVEAVFFETLEEFYNTEDITFEGRGLTIKGRYKNVSMKEYKIISDIFTKKLLQESLRKIKRYLWDLIKSKNNIIYAKHIKTGKKYHLLEAYIDKTRISNLFIRIDNSEHIPRTIEYFPVFIYKIEKHKANIFRAYGTIMNKETLYLHCNILSNKLEQLLKTPISISPFSVSKQKRNIYLSSKNQLTKTIIEYIKRYFNSFGYNAIFIKDNSFSS